MMRMRTKAHAMPPLNGSSGGGGGIDNGSGGAGREGEWELRPGGMVVQKRSDAEHRAPPPTIRVRVKYGSNYHEINISCQATFGELKKMLAGPTGLHHQDQKLIFKDKEKDSKAFLDTSGVKNKSKIVLVEDPISKEKRLLEMRKNARLEKAAKTMSEISLEIDRLAREVSRLESVVSKGGKVAENDVANMIELLMNQLLKLDGVTADGDVKLQRKMQVQRVQEYVETLDMLKMKNSMPKPNGENHTPAQLHPQHNGPSSPRQQQQARRSVRRLPMQQSRCSSSGDVVVTTQWETFDSSPEPLPAPSPTSETVSSNTSNAAQPRFFNWDLLL